MYLFGQRIGPGGDEVEQQQHQLAALWDSLRDVPHHLGVLRGSLAELVELTRHIDASQKRRDTLERSLAISGAQQKLHTHGYRHNRFWASSTQAAKVLTVEIVGVVSTYTVVAGWNAVDWPENTFITGTATGGAADVYAWQFTDEPVI